MGNTQGNVGESKSPAVAPASVAPAAVAPAAVAPGLQPGSIQPPPLTSPAPSNPVIGGGEKASIAKSSIAENKKGKLTNPGVFEELHKKCKEILPNTFDGFRLTVNKGLSSHFHVNHTLKMSAIPNGSSCHFGATYIGGQQTSATDACPVILGDIDTSGSLNAQMIHQLTERVNARCIVQTQEKEFAMIQMDANYRGDDFTAVCTLGNIDILAGSGLIVNHYLQRITENLDIGAECLYQYGPGQEAAVLSLAGRYSTDKWEATAQFNPIGWHASYYHKGNENVSVGVEYEYVSRSQDSCVSMAYQYDIPKANATVRGMCNTNWTVAGVYEKRLQPLPLTFILSAMLNHEKNQSQFGFALQMG